MVKKVQRGRWSIKVNVLKQDRIIYDNEGFDVGFHDGRYKLGKYTVAGFSKKFYHEYEEGYKVGYSEYDENGFDTSTKNYRESANPSTPIKKKNANQDKTIRNNNIKNSGFLVFAIVLSGGVVGTFEIVTNLL